jgi:hypothetical protein
MALPKNLKKVVGALTNKLIWMNMCIHYQ